MTGRGVYNDEQTQLNTSIFDRREKVNVCVIDSGWDSTIIADQVAHGVHILSRRGGSVNICPGSHDVLGHGTKVIDLLLQVEPHLTVVPVQIFNQALEISPNLLIDAIEYAGDQRFDIVNLSLGTMRNDALLPLYRTCRRAADLGIILVAASGASGMSLPAHFDCVIGVECADVATRFDVVHRKGGAAEAGARGFGQMARGLGGKMTIANGTSFAAPIVSARIAQAQIAGAAWDLESARALLASGRLASF